MDEELRELERLRARDPNDDGVRQRLLAARRRAGHPDLAALMKKMGELDAAYRAARAAHATAGEAALRRYVAGLFREDPSLDSVGFLWNIDCPEDDAWTIDCRVRGLEGPTAEDFLAFAPLLVSPWSLSSSVRFVRRSSSVACVMDNRNPGPDRDPPSRRISLRDVYVCQPDDDRLRTAAWFGEEDEPVPLDDGDTVTAFVAFDESAKTLAGARRAFVEAAEPVWDQLGEVLFLENPGLDALAIHGFTEGYNDNWYGEHQQRFVATRDGFEHLARGLRERGLPLLGLDEPGRFLEDREEWALEKLLRPLQEFLRERFGACWIVVLRRGGSVRYGPAWRDY